MKINSDIIRSAYAGMLLKTKIENKNLTITEVAEKMKISQPALSRVLNGKVGGSDNFFIKIGNAINLSPKELEEIFKEADREEYRYKYGEAILSEKELSYEEIFEMIQEKENLTDEQIKAVRDFIEFQKNK